MFFISNTHWILTKLDRTDWQLHWKIHTFFMRINKKKIKRSNDDSRDRILTSYSVNPLKVVIYCAAVVTVILIARCSYSITLSPQHNSLKTKMYFWILFDDNEIVSIYQLIYPCISSKFGIGQCCIQNILNPVLNYIILVTQAKVIEKKKNVKPKISVVNLDVSSKVFRVATNAEHRNTCYDAFCDCIALMRYARNVSR